MGIVEVEVEEGRKKKQSRRSKLVQASLRFCCPSLSKLSLTFFLGTAIHRRCCCQSEFWKGEAEAKSAEEEEEARVDEFLCRPQMISAGSSPANAPIGPSVTSPPVLVEGLHSPLDAQGLENSDWLEEEEENAEDVDVDSAKCSSPSSLLSTPRLV